MPKVSVVVPMYNVEQYLEQCLNSIVSQTFSDIEIILVNDKSPDRSLEIATQFANNDQRIAIINHSENKGLRAAVFTGLAAAAADYVVFVDSDDWLKNGHIETLYNMLETTKADLGIVGFYYCVGDFHKHVKLGDTRVYTKPEIEQEILEPFFEKEEYLIHNIQNSRWGKIYKTKLLREAIKGANQNLIMGEDGELNIRYISLCSAVAVEADYASYCYRGDNFGAMTKLYNYKRLLQNDIYIDELKSIAKRQGREGKAIGFERDNFPEQQLYIYLNAKNNFSDKVLCAKKIMEKIKDKDILKQQAKQSVLPIKIALVLIANNFICSGVFIFQLVLWLKKFKDKK